MPKKVCPCCHGYGETIISKHNGWVDVATCENCRDHRRESIIRQALADPVQRKYVPEEYRNRKFSRGYVWRK